MKHFVVSLMMFLCGCSASINDYHNDGPGLDLRQYFNGSLHATGMFQDAHGKVTRRFTVQLQGVWQGDRGDLTEQFQFQDGERQTRVWHLIRVADGHWQGTAADVVGVAEGESDGNALHWHYTLRVPVNGDSYDFAFDDWMYLLDQGHMFNKAKMKKLGLTVGELTIYFDKPEVVVAAAQDSVTLRSATL